MSMRRLPRISPAFAFAPARQLPFLRRNGHSAPAAVAGDAATAAGDVYIPALATAFPYRWLRDECQCAACVHPTNRQKLHRSSDVPPEPRPAQSALAPDALRITWPGDGGEHTSVYPLEWLARYASADSRRAFHMDGALAPAPWDAARLRAAPHLAVDYAPLHTDPRARLHALTQLLRHGILFLRRVPSAVTADQDCEVRTLARLFGRIRSTLYGEVWNVRTVHNSTNIAFTSLDLGLHMDLQYFQHPPRYQILHCLRNRVHGGTSIFVDALRTAQHLRATAPAAFTTLTLTPVPYHYLTAGHHLHHAHPVIALAPSGAIDHINYSPPFQAPLPLDTPAAFYTALAQFAALLDAEEGRYTHLLHEGDAVIFDNRRVLHARTQFRAREGQAEGETARWLQGCYLEAEDILDMTRRLMREGADHDESAGSADESSPAT